MFPKIGGPQNGFIMEIPMKMDDLGVPPFSETPSSPRFGFFVSPPTAPVNGTPQRPVPAPVPYGVPIYGGGPADFGKDTRGDKHHFCWSNYSDPKKHGQKRGKMVVKSKGNPLLFQQNSGW